MEEQKQEKSNVISFGKFTIFLLVKAAQNSFGIKIGDYMRYRRYCTRKVLKLRKSMNYKYGTRNKFVHKDIVIDKSQDKKILQLLLFQVEKHWAMANQIKLAAQTQQNKQKLRARFFAMKKMKKATQWSQKLKNICQKNTDNITKLQSQAYYLFMQGLLKFEYREWNECLSKLIACRQIIGDLKQISDTITERIFNQKIDQIDQTIKFCNFKISKGKQLPISEIIEMKKIGDPNLSSLIESLTQHRLNEISLNQNHKEVIFGNERYPVKQQKISTLKFQIDNELINLKEIKIKTLKNSDDEQLYQELLLFYSDVVLLIDNAIRMTDSQRQDAKKKEEYTHGQLQILKKISLMFQQMKMKLFIDRNQTIFRHCYDRIGRKSTPQILAKLLTATHNLYTQLSEIIKQKNQIQGTFIQTQLQQIDANIFYLRTIRLLFVGQVYNNNQKYKQAYSLWNQCQRCLKILLIKQQNQNKKNKNQYINFIELQNILEIIKINKIKLLIINFEHQQQKKYELISKIKNIEISSLQKYNKQQQINISLQKLLFNQNNKQLNTISLQKMCQLQIIQLPGCFVPMCTRPIFFDIYQTTMKYPKLESKIKKKNVTSGWWSKLFKGS